jgi:hypothetical protein
MTVVKLGIMTQLHVLKHLMQAHGYSQEAAIDAVDNELHEVWAKLPPGHETTFERITSSVVELRRLRSGHRVRQR